jgi:L-rhamnose isomerase
MACDRMGLPDHIADTRREYEALADEIAACGELLETVGSEVSKDAADALELWALDLAGTWSEVAEEMGVSRRTVARLRDQAFAWLNHHMIFANHSCPRFRVD